MSLSANSGNWLMKPCIHALQSRQISITLANTRLRRCHPTHRSHGLVSVHRAPRAPRHDLSPVLEVGGEYTRNGFAPLLFTLSVRRAVAFACAMKARQIETRPGDERGESGHGRSCASLRPRHTVHPVHIIQRLQHHVGSAVWRWVRFARNARSALSQPISACHPGTAVCTGTRPGPGDPPTSAW